MKRDKIISVRVNSELLDKVQKIIDSRTYCWENLRGNKHYHYKDENGYSHDKYTIADLLESAMNEYIEKFSAEKVIQFRRRKCITI